MGAPRRWASRLLDLAVRRLAPADSGWGSAMLRELDFVAGEWAALAWALGGAAALGRHFLPRRWTLQEIGRTTAGLLVGVVLAAGVLALSLGALLRLLPDSFAAWQQEHAAAAGWLTVVVVPEIVLVLAVASLWPRKRSIAIGVVLAAMTLITHFALYVARHGYAGGSL
jgi:hypothetical protein